MKKLLVLSILTIFCFRGLSQSTLPIRADTVVIEKVGGNGTLKIKNATRDTVGGVLYNIGGGVTEFKKSKRLNDTTIVIGGDTITVGGSTTITNATATGDTLLTASNTIKRLDSDATITRSTNATKILLGVDTTTHIATQYDLTQLQNLSVGTINSQTKSANGAVISGSELVMQTVNPTMPGLIGTGNDTIKGYKIFQDTTQASKLLMGGRLALIGQQDVDPVNQRSLQYASDGSRPAVLQVVATDGVISGTDSTGARGIEFSTYDNSTGGNFIHAKKARGNWQYPSGVQANDILWGVAGWGYCSNVPNFSGSAVGYHMVATENFTSTANGTEFQFFTTKRGQQSGSGRSWNLIMKDDGSNVSIRDSIKAGTLTGNNPALYVSGTLPSTPTATANGAFFNFTSNGSAGQAQQGLFVNLGTGFTGGTMTNALNATNVVANSNTSFEGLTAGYRPIGNRAINATMISTNTGWNTAIVAIAQGGNLNAGVWGTATVGKNNAANVGVAGFALNSGTGTATATGGFFSLQDKNGSVPVYTSAAIVADNGSTTSPIAVFRDNETEVARIADGGEFWTGSTTDQGNYKIQNTGGLYQNGAVSLRGIPAASPGFRILTHDTNADSSVTQITMQQLKDSTSASLSGANGITRTGDNFELGGALTKNSTITSSTDGWGLNITGVHTSTTSTGLLDVTTTGNGNAIRGVATSGTAVVGESTTGHGVVGNSLGSATGVRGQSLTGWGVYGTTSGNTLDGTAVGVAALSSSGAYALRATTISGRSFLFDMNHTSTSTIRTLGVFRREVETFTPAAGVGMGINFEIENASNALVRSNYVTSKLTNVTAGSENSEYELFGLVSGAEQSLLKLTNAGATLGGYGSGTKTGTLAYSLGVTSAGAIIEVPLQTDLALVNDADYTVTASVSAVRYHQNITAARILTIPAASGNTGRELNIKINGVTAGQVTITSTSNIFLNGTSGSTTQPVNTPNYAVILKSDGTSWYQIN